MAFLVPFLYLLPLVMNLNGIFYAQPISDILALVLGLVLVLKEHRKLVKMEGKSMRDYIKERGTALKT